MRTFGLGALVRKVVGLALAVAGIAIVIDSLPPYLLIIFIGIGLIWAGWLVFRMERIY
ncbi:MAG: hypothetical protein GX197_10555 [Firmicutes bacterium]|nr:hypothetical protein [Bacillota bacterium]